MTEPLYHMSLCTGIGGIDLAAEWAGFETVGQCEWGDFQFDQLMKHWPHVPKWRDVYDATVDALRRAGITRIDLLSAGYPCQPFALIGKRRGQEDPRHLWPRIREIVAEWRPAWCFFENVVGHITLGLDDVLDDLEALGYTAIPLVVTAAAAGAPHLRERVLVVGYANSEPATQADPTACTFGEEWDTWQMLTRLTGGAVPGAYWQEHQPPLCGVDDGFPGGVDRSEALGNAVSPQQVYPILRSIYLVEQWRRRRAA